MGTLVETLGKGRQRAITFVKELGRSRNNGEDCFPHCGACGSPLHGGGSQVLSQGEERRQVQGQEVSCRCSRCVCAQIFFMEQSVELVNQPDSGNTMKELTSRNFVILLQIDAIISSFCACPSLRPLQ